MGHINASQAADPYTGGLFPLLTNNNRMLEDSAPVFFLGDTSRRLVRGLLTSQANQGADPKVTIAHDGCDFSGREYGVSRRGGVGASTSGVGAPPTDSYWWITQVQGY